MLSHSSYILFLQLLSQGSADVPALLVEVTRAREAAACQVNLPWVPWATGYGLKLLNTVGSLQRQTIGEPYTMY
jgi:hypothetical protein